jgi:hypothetical protein
LPPPVTITTLPVKSSALSIAYLLMTDYRAGWPREFAALEIRPRFT